MKKKFLILILVLSVFVLPLLVGVVTYAHDDDDEVRDTRDDELPNIDEPVRYAHTGLSVGDSFRGLTLSYNGSYSDWVDDLNNYTGSIILEGYLSDSSDVVVSGNARLAIRKSINGFTSSYVLYYVDQNSNNVVLTSLYNPSGVMILPDDYYFTITSFSHTDELTSLTIYDFYNNDDVDIGEQVSSALTDTFDLGTGILGALASYFDVFVLTDGEVSWITIFLFCCLGIALTVGMTRWLISLIRRKI